MKNIKNIAILCNGKSSIKTDRIELVDLIKEKGYVPYIGGIYDGIINDYYRNENVEFIPLLASRNNTNPIIEIKSIFNVKKMMKQKKIDAAIIYGVKNHPAMAIGCKLAKVKSIMCIVNGSGNLFRIKGMKGFVLRFISLPMLKLAYLFSKWICFQNIDDQNLFLRKKLVKKDKVFLTGGSGVNLDLFKCHTLPKEDKFLFLSRITSSKGINEYIEAARIIKGKFKSATFDIVGPIDNTVENAKNSILNEAIREGIVNYHGETNEVHKWMSKCRYFIYPSYYPEGVPRCVMQALASGRPVITCNTSGCRETVINNVNVFLVEPRNSNVLAEKMIYLIENPKEVEKMAKESRKLAEKKFNVNDVNGELLYKLVN